MASFATLALTLAVALHASSAQFAAWPTYNGVPNEVNETIKVKTVYDGKSVLRLYQKDLASVAWEVWRTVKYQPIFTRRKISPKLPRPLSFL